MHPPASVRSLLTTATPLQVSNTICQTEHIKQANGKLEIMDISPVLAESIRRVSRYGVRSLWETVVANLAAARLADAQWRVHLAALLGRWRFDVLVGWVGGREGG